LSDLTSLTYLSLHDNQISDIYPLVENAGLDTGDAVSLVRNPLSDDSINIYIPELQARGVSVSW
jgi:Leucine-rich repeat (LRR) protein